MKLKHSTLFISKGDESCPLKVKSGEVQIATLQIEDGAVVTVTNIEVIGPTKERWRISLDGIKWVKTLGRPPIVINTAGIQIYVTAKELPGDDPVAHDLTCDLKVTSKIGIVPPKPKKRVVCFGDSITQCWPINNLSRPDTLATAPFSPDSWPKIIEKELGHEVINLGIGGNTTAQMLARFNQVVESRPDVVILTCGINDLIKDGKSVAEAALLRKELINKLKSLDCKIILGVYPNFDETKLDAFRVGLSGMCVDLRASIRNERDFPLIDFDGLLTVPDDFADDGLHPNGFGYKIMGAEAVKRLEEVL